MSNCVDYPTLPYSGTPRIGVGAHVVVAMGRSIVDDIAALPTHCTIDHPTPSCIGSHSPAFGTLANCNSSLVFGMAHEIRERTHVRQK